MKTAVLRIARPTDRMSEVAEMYRKGLGLETLAAFEDHHGFDGVVLGHPRAPYHIEFTRKSGHPAGNAPTEDNLLVFYLPETSVYQERCRRMVAAGFRPVAAFNPYWDKTGTTFEDPDGYRVVLQNSAWEK